MIPNKIIHKPEENIVLIRVTRRDGTEHDVIVDNFIYEMISHLHIYVSPTRHKRKEFYARTYIDGKQFQLHRLIIQGFLSKRYPEVDHIDPYKTLDNRLSNLRPADRKLQRTNLKKHKKPSEVQPNLLLAA